MLIPFSLSWKNFLFVRRKCLQTDHVLGLLSRTCKLLSSRSKNSSKKKSSEDFVVIWVKLSLGILHSLEQGVSDWNSERSRRKRYGSSYNDVTAHSRVQAPVVQKVDRATHRITYYPVDRAIGFGNTYRLENELSGEERYPTFERPGPSLTEPRTSTQGPGWIAS